MVTVGALEQRLRIKPGHRVAVVNAPVESRRQLLAGDRPDADHADVVIGFATRAVDLSWLKPVYAAAWGGRLAWVGYPKPGRPGSDLRREWLRRALPRYGVDASQTCRSMRRGRRCGCARSTTATAVRAADTASDRSLLDAG